MLISYDFVLIKHHGKNSKPIDSILFDIHDTYCVDYSSLNVNTILPRVN
jgi:hypothetical protein